MIKMDPEVVRNDPRCKKFLDEYIGDSDIYKTVNFYEIDNEIVTQSQYSPEILAGIPSGDVRTASTNLFKIKMTDDFVLVQPEGSDEWIKLVGLQDL